MSGHVRWSDIRAEYVARAGGEAAVQAAGQRALQAAARQATEDHIRRQSVINPDPAGVRPFPWQCPTCGHRREDHRSPDTSRPEAAWPVGSPVPAWATCADCPSCTEPDRR